MLNLTITTSVGRFVFSVASPVDDTLSIRYNDCHYCGKPTLKDKFCSHTHRSLYHYHRIVEKESLTPPRQMALLRRR